MAATSPAQNPQFDSLGRSPEALPFWSRYSLPQRVVFPAANTKRDVAHGLGAIPSGYLVLWSDAPISATPGVNWTPEIAYLQSPVTNARAIVIFVQLRESVALGAGGELLGPPPVIAPPTSPPWTMIVNADTDTISNWNPGHIGQGNVFVVWGGASDLTVTSMAAGVAGQIVTIRNASQANAFFAHFGAGTAPLSNMTSSGPTPIGSQSGSISYQWDSNAAVWRLTAHEQGAWITPPFNAADYWVDVGTWPISAGNVYEHAYRVSGRSLEWKVALAGASLSQPVSVMSIAMPSGYRCGLLNSYVFELGWLNDGTSRVAETYMYPNQHILYFRGLGGGTISGTPNVHVALTVPLV